MTGLQASAIQSAAQRLRGHLVVTPLIGGVRLPGLKVVADLRLKPEILQPGGTLWYRGAEHFLLRQLGACKGFVLHGNLRGMLATALAAHGHRVPAAAYFREAPSQDWRRQFEELECEIEVAGDAFEAIAGERRRREGLTAMPGPGQEDFDLGIATVSLELAQTLPTDCAAVFVDSAFAAAVEAGLLANGRGCQVRATVERPSPGLAAAMHLGHRLHCSEAGLGALTAALEETKGVVAVVLAG